MRLRKTDRELLAFLDGMIEDHLDGKQRKQWGSFYERVLSEELKGARKEDGGLTVNAAIKAIKEVAGNRAYMPAGKPPPVWFITLQNRIKQSGLTEALVREATKTAMVLWKGNFKVDSVIRQTDRLLAEGSLDSTPSLPDRREDLEEL